MKINVSYGTLDVTDEKTILIALLGCLEAIKQGGLSIDESEKLIFSPRTVNSLSKINCDEKVLELIREGCELEDVVSLVPDKFEYVLEKMKYKAINLLKQYEEKKEEFWVEW